VLGEAKSQQHCSIVGWRLLATEGVVAIVTPHLKRYRHSHSNELLRLDTDRVGSSFAHVAA
jgi:hypothetical protein